MCDARQICRECIPELNNRCCNSNFRWVPAKWPCLYEEGMYCSVQHVCISGSPNLGEEDTQYAECEQDSECCLDGQMVPPGESCRFSDRYLCDNRNLCRVCDPDMNQECCTGYMDWVKPMRPCLVTENKYCGTDHVCYDNPDPLECDSRSNPYCCFEGKWIPEGEPCTYGDETQKCTKGHHCVARSIPEEPYTDTAPVVDLVDFGLEPEEIAALDPYFEKLSYVPSNAPKKILPPLDRYFLYTPHFSGFNNRRMSLECAFVFAYLTNRTFVLLEQEVFVPYLVSGLESKFWDILSMKRGHPTLSYTEFISLPNYEEIMSDVVHIPWKDLSGGDSIIYVPSMIQEGDVDWEHYISWRAPRGPEPPPEYGTKYDFNTLRRFRESRVLQLDTPAFTHFHTLFYPRWNSGFSFTSIKRLIRNHVTFRPEIFRVAAWVLSHLPKKFQSLHIRRGDLDYPTAQVKPHTMFYNLVEIYTPGLPLYIATDHPHKKFKREFLPHFNRTYPVITFHHVKHLIPFIDPKWVPLIEQLICSVGKVFVGTLYSTFTSYIHRLRGYSRLDIDRNVYFTHITYKAANTEQEITYYGWDREYPRSWDNID
eukprot:TRINITY_DN2245_c0_g2_i5.p1 TRINITY_DN2245_c0_g2~~TRINITY_DN2245_c0_g2_i5.p1  ORF type:complete len:594 (+),score=91.89 TRINITY_DN2245_c0_g2_i5:298-2079(+)